MAVTDDDTSQFITLKAIRSIASSNRVLQFLNGIDAIRFLLKMLVGLRYYQMSVSLASTCACLTAGCLWKRQHFKRRNKKNRSSIDAYDIARARQNKNIADYLVKPVSIDKFKELLTSTLS